MSFSRLVFAALLVPTLAAAQEAYAPPPPPPPVYPAYPVAPAPERQASGRDTWYIGFGLGAGGGRVSQGGTSYSFKDYQGNGATTDVSINFKVGATLSPRLLAGFDASAVRSATDANGATTGVQINNYDAMLTFFPSERGFFVRGGAGLSVIVEEVSVPGFASASRSTNGVNVLAGLGYAWWIGQHFNLTANLDFSGQSYGSSSDKPERSSAWALWLGFDWY
jgi:hypothetical protein